MTTNIYLEALSDVENLERVLVSIESYVCLFVHRYLNANHIQVNIIKAEQEVSSYDGLYVDLSEFKPTLLTIGSYAQNLAHLCNFPVLLSGTNVVVAGLCGVCRGMVKASTGAEELLGFKGGCLVAPAETSVWTKFCELDVIHATKWILKEINNSSDKVFQLPSEFGRFEHHMDQPVRVHNIYKLARNQAQDELKKSLKDDQLNEITVKLNQVKLNGVPRKLRKAARIQSSVPMAELNIAHTFAEGQHITLADLILFSCFRLARDVLPKDLLVNLELELPLTMQWLNEVDSTLKQHRPIKYNLTHSSDAAASTIHIDKSDIRSLYKNDSKRYKPRSQIFTKQNDIEASLSKVHALQLSIRSDDERFHQSDFAWWSTLPYDALPEGGALPPDRLLRKKHQLQSLAVEVLRVARPGDRIVDFCSGAGHLGIIIATLRPDCKVVLLENKEDSLMRAKNRVERLGITNVSFFQCNLDYFRGHFDVGTSLHACGVATDIVLLHCMNQRASFVCCPCCYGGIRPMAHIAYPRSARFRLDAGMTTQDCLHVGHCADQAHDILKGPCNVEKAKQGQECMDVVDWDRKLCAEENGYEVVLTRLQPEDCTPKNRLLVGTVA